MTYSLVQIYRRFWRTCCPILLFYQTTRREVQHSDTKITILWWCCLLGYRRFRNQCCFNPYDIQTFHPQDGRCNVIRQGDTHTSTELRDVTAQQDHSTDGRSATASAQDIHCLLRNRAAKIFNDRSQRAARALTCCSVLFYISLLAVSRTELLSPFLSCRSKTGRLTEDSWTT